MDMTSTNASACPQEPGIKRVFELVSSNPALNITELVAACPDTCKLVLGLGNPDISGIGVNIAYAIQVSASLFFGPVLYFILLLWPKRIGRRLWPLYYELLDTLVKLNAAFTFPIGIAACVAISQYPTVFELKFLNTITIAQAFSLVSVVAPCVTVARKLHRNDDTRFKEPVHSGWIRLLLGIFSHEQCQFCHTMFPCFFSFAVCIMFSTISAALVTLSRPYDDMINVFKSACDVVKGLYYDDLGGDAFAASISVWILKGIVILVPVTHVVLVRAKVVLFGRLNVQSGTSPARLKLIVSNFIPPAFGAFGGVAALYLWASSQKQRQTAMAFVDGQSSDNLWGFGQVVALFMWTPLLFKFLKCGLDLWRLRQGSKYDPESCSPTPPGVKRRYTA